MMFTSFTTEELQTAFALAGFDMDHVTEADLELVDELWNEARRAAYPRCPIEERE
jgi:hypothetical protein